MTIAIAAITNPDDLIVCVSDRMISFGDVFQAEDNAIVKAIRLHDQWTVAWAANDVSVILPIVEEIRRRLDGKIQGWSGREAADALAEVYSERAHKEFVSTHLSKFGYKTMEEFRTKGRADLGDNNFTEIVVDLGRFYLGASFLLFGHDKQKHGKLYCIEGPGHSVDCNAGVGKTTTVALRNREGRVTLLPRSEIEEIRKIWRRDVADVPDPPDAIAILEKSHAVTEVAGER